MTACSVFAILVFVCLPVIKSSSVQLCYSNKCPTSSICVKLCHPLTNDCYVQRNYTAGEYVVVDAGCAPDPLSTCRRVTTSNYFLPISLFCTCSGSHCNYQTPFSERVEQLLEVYHVPPPAEEPQIVGGRTVCEQYKCSPLYPFTCTHGYEICANTNYCQAKYINDQSTGKLKIHDKGCYESPETVIRLECHVNNPLHAPPGAVYSCVCNGSLCNLNTTFTHPTQFIGYGALTCQRHNCSQICKIVDQKPQCSCRVGFQMLEDNLTCADINECQLAHNYGNCSHWCRNTRGSYVCWCDPDMYLSYDGLTCKFREGLVCGRQRCVDECSAVTDHYCFDAVSERFQGNVTFCFASYLNTTSGWKPRFSQCITGSAQVCLNDSKCVLTRIFPQHEEYHCCCKSNHCNTQENVIFPGETTLPVVSSTSSHSQYIATAHSSSMRPSVTQSSEPGDSSMDTMGLPQHYLVLLSCLAGVVVLIIVVAVIVISVTHCYEKRKRSVNLDETVPNVELREVELKQTKPAETVYGETSFKTNQPFEIGTAINVASSEEEVALQRSSFKRSSTSSSSHYKAEPITVDCEVECYSSNSFNDISLSSQSNAASQVSVQLDGNSAANKPTKVIECGIRGYEETASEEDIGSLEQEEENKDEKKEVEEKEVDDEEVEKDEEEKVEEEENVEVEEEDGNVEEDGPSSAGNNKVETQDQM